MIEFWAGYACGAITSIYLAWQVHKRLLKRIYMIKGIDLLAHDLETRREIIDYGRTDEVRTEAGPAGVESNLFEISPGALTLSHLQEKKITEAVDTQQD